MCPYTLICVGEKNESAFLTINGMMASDQTIGQSGFCFTTVVLFVVFTVGGHYW